MWNWMRKKFGLDDKDFNQAFPWGTCQAHWSVPGQIPQVTCGKRTNHHPGEYWACGEHSPPPPHSMGLTLLWTLRINCAVTGWNPRRRIH